MQAFLNTLYKKSANNNVDSAIDDLYDTLAELHNQDHDNSIDFILGNVDLSKLNTSIIYTMVFLTSSFSKSLKNYNSFYHKAREEFARKEKSPEYIAKLFDKYENGMDDDMPHGRTLEQVEQDRENKLDNAIKRAKFEFKDKDIVEYLEYYKSVCLQRRTNENEFHNLRMLLGDEELRRRAINSLREVADKLEKADGWPGIFYCKLPAEPLLDKTFIDGIEVVISYPWPG